MATVNVNLTCDLQHPVQVQYIGGNMFSQDNAGNTINVDVFNDGEPATLGGSISANVIRADGATVAVSGALSGNRAYVIFPQACYAVPGTITVIIKNTESSTVTTIAAFVANVYQSTTDTVVDPGQIIPSVSALIAQIEAAVDSIPVDYSGLLATIAADYSSSKTYPVVGMYAWQGGVLKRNIVPITTAETYTAAHWTNAILGDDVTALKSAFDSAFVTIKGKNLFNKSAVLVNKYCNVNGEISDYSGRYVTDYIPVEVGKKVTSSYLNAATHIQTQSNYSAICCYNSNKEVVSGGDTYQQTFTVPIGVAYVRITFSASMYTYDGMVELTDNGVYTTYVPYHDPTIALDEDVVVSQSNVAGLTEKLEQIDSNIDDNADAIDDILSAGITFTQNGYIGSNGSFVSNENYLATDYINCVENGTFIKYKYRLQVFSNTKIAYYDKNKTCISVLSPSSSGSLEYVEGYAPFVETAQYIRFCTYADAVGYYVKYATVKNQFVGDDFLDTGITFTESGFIRYDGRLVENSSYIATDYIDCIAGGTFVPYKYRLRMFDNTKIAYYNENKQFISAISPSSSGSLEYVEGVVPYVDKAKYIRFCTAADAVGYYVKYASVKNTYVADTPANPCDYTGNDLSVFNKILCIGDSLTSGTFNYRVGDTTGNYVEYDKYSYPTYLKKLSGCDTVNMGNGGMTSAEWYAAHENDDLSGYDCAIIQLGVNDVIRYTTFGETSETAFENIFAKLKTDNKNIKIFVANIIPASSYNNSYYVAFSSDLSDFIEGLDDPQIILLDMQQYGHTMDSTAFNCGHLSAYGYWRLAQDYKAYIGWYMNQNKTAFKEVQFIGTDYYYDPIT